MTKEQQFEKAFDEAKRRGLSDKEARDVANFEVYGSDVIGDDESPNEEGNDE